MHDVSIIQLIARPEQFHGKRVRVTGYLWLEFEGNGVYLSESDRTHGVYKNGLWVSFAPGVLDPRREYSGRYVLLEGTFNAEHRGHLGLWSGAIEQITRALPWPPDRVRAHRIHARERSCSTCFAASASAAPSS